MGEMCFNFHYIIDFYKNNFRFFRGIRVSIALIYSYIYLSVIVIIVYV